MVTIKDIARETGLGLATISKYLNGGNVRPENRILIKDAITRLDFKVNEFARALKTNKSKTVGIVIPELSNLFVTTILTEVEDMLRQNGYATLIADCRTDEKLEKKAVDFMLSKQVDGIINMPVSSTGEHLKSAIEREIPIVLIDRRIQNIETNFIGVDNVNAGRMATQYLIDNNHKNIGIIAGPKILSTAVERLEGYKNALTENYIPLNERFISISDYSIQSGHTKVSELLQNNKDITALFCTNYEITVGAIIAINELNLKIPDDISVVGFDNIELSKVIQPKLTIVCQPIRKIARKLANTMLRRLRNEGTNSNIVLDAFIQEGKSVKKI